MDAESVLWLEQHLNKYVGAVVAITHDRYFLDNVAQWILELDRGRAYPYEGNYSTYLETKAARLKVEGQKDAKRAKRLAEELDWVRQNAKGRQAKSKARLARYEEMAAEADKMRKLDFEEIQIPPGPRLGNVVIEVNNLTKGYGDRVLIEDLSFTLPRNGIVGIIGPNGAGKTTMMDIITGKTRPDEGQVFFGSTIDLLRYNEPEIAQLGIGRKFQKPTVFEQLSVFENLELALKTPKGVKASMFFKLDSVQSDRLAEVLHTIHLADSVLSQAGNLSHGQKQWLEIGMLLMQDPKLLLLDEPVAGMTDHETERTAELFLSLKGKHSLMVVEHDMSFINTISDIVTVLCDGSVLAQGTLAQVQADERVIEVYLGR